MTDFSTLMNSLTQTSESRWQAQITPDWLQGRTVFGGTIAALAYRAMRHEVSADRKLITLDVSFIGPIQPGPINITTRVLRAGGYVTHTAADIINDAGETLVRISAVFGSPRETSKISVTPDTPHPSMPREKGTEFPFIPGITPEFSKHFEYWLTEGEFPYSGSKSGTIGGYFRHKTPHNDPLEAVIALLDAWPPAVIPMSNKPFAASTVRWTCHFLNEIPADFDDYYWFRDETLAAKFGYGTTIATLTAGDQVIAWAEQLIAVFDN